MRHVAYPLEPHLGAKSDQTTQTPPATSTVRAGPRRPGGSSGRAAVVELVQEGAGGVELAALAGVGQLLGLQQVEAQAGELALRRRGLPAAPMWRGPGPGAHLAQKVVEKPSSTLRWAISSALRGASGWLSRLSSTSRMSGVVQS